MRRILPTLEPGGPRAIPDASIWSTPEGEAGRGDCHYGCAVARRAGARIPRNTYHDADPWVSQYEFGGTGSNLTALLPIEVDSR